MYRGSTEVEHLTHNLRFEGSGPATSIGRKKCGEETRLKIKVRLVGVFWVFILSDRVSVC